MYSLYSQYNGFPYPDGSIIYNLMPEVYKRELPGILKPDGFIDTDKAPLQETSDVGPVIFFGGYLLKVYFAEDENGNMSPKILGYQHGN